MENGKDTRADKPCLFLAAGHCRLGPNCPWNRNIKPGKGIDSAAAPSGDPTKKGDRQLCRLFQESGKCRFGAACSFSHDAPPNIKSDKKPEK
eukprot:13009259-Heterocapsa_arctica.AAC.1